MNQILHVKSRTIKGEFLSSWWRQVLLEDFVPDNSLQGVPTACEQQGEPFAECCVCSITDHCS